MSFRKMRCQHGLRREDVFVLLIALADGMEDLADGPPPPDLSMLMEPHPSHAPAEGGGPADAADLGL